MGMFTVGTPTGGRGDSQLLEIDWELAGSWLAAK